MGTITLPNFRTTADVRMNTRLKDGGMYIDWTGLSDIKVWLWSESQKAIAGRCDVEIDEADSTKLVCRYSASKPQYLGLNKIIVQATYMGGTKTYDKTVFNFVRWTADQAGTQITIDDPEVDVEIVAEDISSSIINEAVRAALAAAAHAEHAASLVPLQVLQDCEAATAVALTAASKAPVIGENGHWWVWNSQLAAYVDTGKQAKGDTGNGIASFSVVESQEDDADNVVTVTFTDGTTETFTVKNGKTGNGIASIVQTVESPDDAGTNVITVTMTNGTVITFNVKNGSKGQPGAAQAAYKSVETLPTASAETMDKIYLTPSGTSDVYNMSYTDFDGASYSWVPLGTTAIQLSDYATKAEVSQLEAEVNGGTDTETIDGTTLGSFENGAIGSSGDINTSSTYKHLTLANEGYTRVTGHGSNYKNLPILAFYNGTPSSETLISSVPEGTTNYTDKTFDETVPAGTAYIVVCYTTNSPATPATITLYKTVATNGIRQKVEALEDAMEGVDDSIEQVEGTVSELSGTVDGIADDVDAVSNDLEILVGQYTPGGDVTVDWGTVESGKYWNLDGNNKAALVSSSNYSARATLYQVTPGQEILITTPEEKSAAAAAYSGYDNDGNPAYQSGTLARQNWSNATSVVANGDGTYTYTFKLGANCTQVGFYYAGSTPYVIKFGTDAVIVYSQALDEHIEQLVGESNSAHYYLKGNSNIVYSNAKKLGIIAAGQSNIDGRNSYSDLPSGFVNPNANVRFCNNTNGIFADFQVTDGGAGDDWSFDAIVYDLLTKSAYGNQSEIYVMKKSMGGTSIDPDGATNYHWTADYEFLSSETYSILRTFEKTIRKAKELQGENFEIKAMLWHQGEGDSTTQEVADKYYDNLRNMLAYVRGVVGNPRLYVFCGNLSLNAANVGYKAVINAAYARLASEDPYLKVVDMSDAAMEDNYHFNYQWSIYFGQKVYDLMIDAGIISGTKINPSEPS